MEIKFSENDIRDLLNKLIIFEPILGHYQFFTVNEHFTYIVKLTNGTIYFTIDELIANKENQISKEQLILIADRFKKSNSDSSQKRQESVIPHQYTDHLSPKRKKSKTLILACGIILAISTIGAIVALTKNPGSEVPPNTEESSDLIDQSIQTQIQQKPKTEEELKEDIYKLELTNPKKYIEIEYSWQESLLFDQMKFEGQIRNNASMATFRNIDVTIRGYSDTDYLLEERDYVIMETVSPTGSTSFKLRTEGWQSKVRRFEMTINSAEGI